MLDRFLRLTGSHLYRCDLSPLPRLTPGEERELAGHARQGDVQACHRLIERCLGCVIFLAARSRPNWVAFPMENFRLYLPNFLLSYTLGR